MANIGYIQVNRFCNNKCHFCSNPSTGKNISFKKGIDLINDLKKRNYSGVIFTGGEPTLSSNLVKWIKYSNNIGMDCRIISNGMQCADKEYIKQLNKAGLNLVHFSLYSYIDKIHDFLTDTPGSYRKVLEAIQNALNLGIRVQLNTVINKYNQTHLDKTVKFIVKNFGNINHFVWNNLDPQMMRQTNIALSTLPDFKISGKYLVKAMTFLEGNNKTFRVERLPLCFMRGFEWASTETRKIVKEEERIVYFLDFRKNFQELDWEHDKLGECRNCDLNSICAGVYEYKKYYNYVKIKAQKLTKREKEIIIYKIKN